MHTSVRRAAAKRVEVPAARSPRWRWNQCSFLPPPCASPTFRCATPARRGAFADERRIAAGDEGSAQDTGDKDRGPDSGRWVLACALPRSSGRQRVEVTVVRSGSRGWNSNALPRSSHRRAHRHPPIRFARALRRIRRGAAPSCRRRIKHGRRKRVIGDGFFVFGVFSMAQAEKRGAALPKLRCLRPLSTCHPAVCDTL